MPTLNEHFRTEARDFLNALERSLQRAPTPDAAELHRAVRGLRGIAQMAREQRIFDIASAFESVTRAIATGALSWSENIAARARETLTDLRVLLDRREEDEELDARVSKATARWREADPDPAPPAGAPIVVHGTREFREFTAHEAAGIADALDRGVNALQSDPMDREPLTSILRRQRALLGSARLDEIPVIADILRAVEDLTRVIVKLDVGVKKEWLDIYRVARDALQSTIAPLLRDQLPEPSHAVSRLRHMREELLERYGSTVEPPPPAEDPIAPHTLSHPAAPFLASSTAAAPPPANDAKNDVAPFAGAPAATSQAPALELDVDNVVDEEAGMLELDADSVVDEEAGMLELDADSVVDEEGGMLELDADSVVDEEGGMLELDADSVVDEEAGMLELDADSVVDEEAGMLELDADSVVDEEGGMLELDAESIVDEEGVTAELNEVSVIDEGLYAAQPAYSRREALQRALELRDVVTRVAAHDPQARAAVEELFDLVRIALG